jgi:hypothetical protein
MLNEYPRNDHAGAFRTEDDETEEPSMGDVTEGPIILRYAKDLGDKGAFPADCMTHCK